MVIGGHPQRAPSGYFQQAPEEPSGGRPIAVLTEHRVERLAIAIDRAVEVAPTTSDLHVRLVQIQRPPGATMPRVRRSALISSEKRNSQARIVS